MSSSKNNRATVRVVLVAVVVIAAIALMVRQPWNAPVASGSATTPDAQPVAAAAAVKAPMSQPVIVTQPAHMSGANLQPAQGSVSGSAVTQ